MFAKPPVKSNIILDAFANPRSPNFILHSTIKKSWFPNHRLTFKKGIYKSSQKILFSFHRLASHEMRSYKWKERKIFHFISALYLFKYVKSSYRIWNIRRHMLTHSLLLCMFVQLHIPHTKKLSFLLFVILFFEDCLYLAMGGRREFEGWELFYFFFSIHLKTAMSHCVFVPTHIRYHEILFYFFYFNQIESVFIFFFEKRSATNMITIETIEEKQKTWDDVWQGNFHFLLFFSSQKNLVLIIN